tara:strand:+ start:2775 stop:3140 length:366 start_codon:yes stop_codon:yes gene_type:complete
MIVPSDRRSDPRYKYLCWVALVRKKSIRENLTASPASKPPRMFRRVEVLEPEGPMRATSSHFLMLMSTPFSTCTLLDPDPNVLANVFTSSIDAFSSTYETIPLEMHPFVLEMASNPKKIIK